MINDDDDDNYDYDYDDVGCDDYEDCDGDVDEVNICFRWKERFFILTKDYFHCFKKDSSKLTEMGEFLFKVCEH